MRQARAAISAAAVSWLLMGLPAMAGEGDLDPTFGDHGRLAPVPGLSGPAWTLAVLDDDSIVLAGGELSAICADGTDPYDCGFQYPIVGYRAQSFVARVSSSGSIDPVFDAYESAKLHIRGMARQDDGKLVIVGRRVSETSLIGRLIVRRINPDGSDDLTFGQAGKFLLPRPPGGHHRHVATSVIVDPDGRIVVAGIMGQSHGPVVVIRLLPDGSLDDSFASSGVYYRANFSGFYSRDEDPGPVLLRTSDGGYRITDGTCRVLALTQQGVLDPAFGNAGIATANANAYCPAIAMQPDGSLIVAGLLNERPFITRLFANGVPDPNFAENGIADSLRSTGWITALAVSGNSILAASASGRWNGLPGHGRTAITKLQRSGELDHSFGDVGTTTIDLPSGGGLHALVHDVHVLEDRSILAVGGDTLTDQPFAIRLLGAHGGESAGVIGISTQGALTIRERNREIILGVRRTGGSSGRVSVRYNVHGCCESRSATAGEDFVASNGRLVWNDGDSSSRQIRVQILDDEEREEFEFVEVRLSHAAGGAGFGKRRAIVEILAND